MAEYRVTGPDGTKYKVTGPDGASDQQVLSQVQAYSAPKPAAGPVQPPSDVVPGTPPQPKPEDQPPEPSMFDKYVKGPAEGIVSGAAGMAAAPIGAAAGVARNVLGGTLGTQEGLRKAEETAGKVSGAIQKPFLPRSQSGRDFSETAGRVFDATKLQGLNPSEGMAAGSLAKPSASVLSQAAKESPEAFALKQGASKVGQAMRPNIDPQVAQLAQKAESMGIKIPPDMLSDNKFLRIIGQASREVPLSGSGVAENRTAFNQAIIRAFGGDPMEGKISPKVFDDAMNRYGSVIGDISAKYPVPLSAPLTKRLAEIEFQAANFEVADVAKVVKSYADEMRRLGHAEQVIDGESFRKLRTKLTGQMRRTNNGDLKHALSELDDTMLDAIQSQLSPQELEQFNQARRYYANGKTVEPLIAKAASKGQGNMSPAALAGRVTATSAGKAATARGRGGDLADISAVGNRFMTEPGSSNTAERNLAYGALGGSGFANPLLPVGIYGAANLYNRLGPRITRGMIPRPPQE